MLSFFLKIMKQKCGRHVTTQLLQTLNIMFENIRHETSLCKKTEVFFCKLNEKLKENFSFSDYLLSNNQVNMIITHRFDFSDEEILAYYISFLKTLSFKLNSNTIHFFFNEVNFSFLIWEFVNLLCENFSIDDYGLKTILKYKKAKIFILKFEKNAQKIANSQTEIESILFFKIKSEKKFRLFQHTNDFPLYAEAIKFFNHSESMVRIAVRTLTLNVFKGSFFAFIFFFS